MIKKRLRRFLACSAFAIGAWAIACSNDYNLTDPASSPEAGTPEASTALPATDAAATDAGTDADPDASSICARNPGYVFCDQFNAASIDQAWTATTSGNGSVVLDSTHVESSPTAVEVTLPTNTSNEDSTATLERTVSTSGVGTWTTYLWIDPLTVQDATPITFLQISFANADNGTSSIGLQLTAQGLSSVYDVGVLEQHEPIAITYPFGRWVEVEFAFDLQAGHVVFQFDMEQASGSFPVSLDVPPNLSQVTLQLGLSQYSPVNTPIKAWFDDSIFLLEN